MWTTTQPIKRLPVGFQGFAMGKKSFGVRGLPLTPCSCSGITKQKSGHLSIKKLRPHFTRKILLINLHFPPVHPNKPSRVLLYFGRFDQAQ